MRGVSGRRGKEAVRSWSYRLSGVGGPSILTPSSVTAVNLVPDPVRLCPSEFLRGRVVSRNLLVCEGIVVDMTGKAESGGGGGGGRGDKVGGGAAGGKTEVARDRPVTDGVYWVRFAGRVVVRLIELLESCGPDDERGERGAA